MNSTGGLPMREFGVRAACALALTASLAGCVHSTSQVASATDEKDGQTFAAKPGMARLYVVQGLERMGDEAGDTSGSAITGPSGSPQMVGAALGLAIAALVKANRDKPEAPPVIPPDPMDRDNKMKHYPIALPNDIFVNDQKVGTVGHLQYVALDLPPADYVVKVTAATAWQQPYGQRTVTLKAGDVTYLMNTELAYHSSKSNERSIVECQPADCQTYVLAGHRVGGDGK
jgi:hypothetical protein